MCVCVGLNASGVETVNKFLIALLSCMRGICEYYSSLKLNIFAFFRTRLKLNKIF